MPVSDQQREYLMGLRRGLNLIIRASSEPDESKRPAMILDGIVRMLQAHERFTGATVGTAAILRPLILTAADSDQPLVAIVRAIEQALSIQPSLSERGVRY